MITHDITDRLVRFEGKVCVSADLEVEAAIEIDRLRAEAAQQERRYLSAMKSRQMWRETCEAAQRQADNLREHVGRQQLDIATLGGEPGALREALEQIATHDVPRNIGKVWRSDGLPSKNDACTHGTPLWQDCAACVAAYARAALNKGGSR